MPPLGLGQGVAPGSGHRMSHSLLALEWTFCPSPGCPGVGCEFSPFLPYWSRHTWMARLWTPSVWRCTGTPARLHKYMLAGRCAHEWINVCRLPATGWSSFWLALLSEAHTPQAVPPKHTGPTMESSGPPLPNPYLALALCLSSSCLSSFRHVGDLFFFFRILIILEYMTSKVT